MIAEGVLTIFQARHEPIDTQLALTCPNEKQNIQLHQQKMLPIGIGAGSSVFHLINTCSFVWLIKEDKSVQIIKKKDTYTVHLKSERNI